MRTAGIKPGDLVVLDVKGSRGFGEVRGRNDRGEFEVVPFQIARNTVSYVPRRFVTSRQIIGHYSKRKGSA